MPTVRPRLPPSPALFHLGSTRALACGVRRPRRTPPPTDSTKHCNYNQSASMFPPGRRSLPLPGGEGRGEGERKHYSVQGCWARWKVQEILSPRERDRPGRSHPASRRLASSAPAVHGARLCPQDQSQRVRPSIRVNCIPGRRLFARVSATGLGGTVALQQSSACGSHAGCVRPSLPARNEWGESRREGLASKKKFLPSPSINFFQ
jgi:hypothetical protein